MYLQTSRYSLGPAKLTPSPTEQHLRLVHPSIVRSGFCSVATRSHRGFVGVRCEGKEDDGFYIRRCVELARKAIGCTSPNPMVGCVIVKDGKIVGEGFHPKAGQPHAEVFAVRDAGDLAQNSTAYVSLEPCNHYGRTPPCTEAFIKAKVKKVVVGMVDPNPIVASKGVDRLRDAGIDVTVAVEEELCKKLNEAYIHQMLTGRPFVTLRYSLSIDGHLQDQLGEEVTEPGGYYSHLLQEYDAIVLSSASVNGKPSFPASKEPGANQPLQILIATDPSSPVQIPAIPAELTSKVIIFTDREATVHPETAKRGVETVVLDRLDLGMILDYCKQRGLCSVLLDLRGNSRDFEEILRVGFEQNLLQKVVVEVLPVWGGNKEENLPVALTNLQQRLKLRNLTSRHSGHGVLLEGYF
ncbi:riboflavin biosynthesis protein PYRD, chloroplastic [Diospyros lotus]|uniref:riboflavin biosynthesis protein PYRD, chloroplastic n=1 Tax=Diospyros lotus TaxID=55363 RepID=UPI002250B1E1|nr:riboflavin biosynthesis protein PYRD, chloroplastic [Diospyros lotus]XP_052210965.1 riboflavin biosynthesis protein PYRD, chloroplastic [Diospyros lotus]XP_052210966.1 riboflavin biosynthesis protein PYRD, chloroplastic [Diospyros lotus]XP_052210967.1 riboflavin biosynthesis protein PYRD, chloroplastic [Diospyros lotus]XP_052210968.1 riboflavin biosynthesis protein PYRD, chloroplastic [Diospyros lotus]